MCEEFNTASSVEHDNTDQVGIIVGGEQAAMEKRVDMLHHSSVILNAIQSAHASRSQER